MNNPVLILNKNAKRQTGHKAQMDIIAASKAVADIVRTTLGPRAMIKMLLDPNGSVVLTNDGAGILREIEVRHPAAKTIIELSRTQDERIGDGTTSVVVLAGELLAAARPFLESGMHPSRIVKAYRQVQEDCLQRLPELTIPLDPKDRSALVEMAAQALDTKFVARFGELVPSLAVDAVLTVSKGEGEDRVADVKTLVKVEKVPGGEITDCKVLQGIMINKDVLHSGMRRKILNPRILLLDSALEYKKAESETNIEVTRAEDWKKYLDLEENFIRELCRDVHALRPDVLVTERGVSDMAQYFLQAAGVSVLRRARKSDIQRLALASGAEVGSNPKSMKESQLGLHCGLFEVRKIGDDYFSFFEECKEAKACSVLLRGGSRDVLAEVERNFADAMAAVRNAQNNPRKLPGGGATEASLAAHLRKRAPELGREIEVKPYLAAAKALEVIPRTLVENCGGKAARVLAELRVRHEADRDCKSGVDGRTGEVTKDAPMWEPMAVKEIALKTAFEAAAVLLRIDDVLSGVSKGGQEGASQGPGMM